MPTANPSGQFVGVEEPTMQKVAQERFNEKYITAGQIMRDLGISRSALLYARRTNKLPNPIYVNEGKLFIWEREPLEAYLDAWKAVLKARRGA